MIHALKRLPESTVWLALAAGLITSAAFPPLNFRFMGLGGVALLYAALRRSNGFSSGWLYGVGLLAPQLHWLANFHPLAPWAVITLSALPYGFAARATRSLLLFALAMTAADVFRSLGVLALPWGVLGALASETRFASLAAWMGVSGISFLVYLLAGSLVSGGRSACAGIFTGFAVWIACSASINASPDARSPMIDRIVIGVVQAGIAPDRDYEFDPEGVLSRLECATDKLARRGAQIVVWSETVILEYLNRSSFVRDRITAFARDRGITIICGAPTIITERDKRNSAFIFESDGNGRSGGRRIGRYDKVHLVPFGEYIPGYGPDLGHELLPQGVGDFSSPPLLLPVGRFGPLICYEGIFSDLARRHLLAGAKIIINISNDAWSRSRDEAEQHNQLTLLRASEFARPFVRAGNAGPSVIVDADGRVCARLSAGREGVILAEVEVPTRRTLVLLWGDWFGWLALWGLPFSLTAASLVAEDRR